ncbi:MAG TPA: gluconate 2-dehydrogenase subunit 3 family protein [Ktedonobacterales bacterium]
MDLRTGEPLAPTAQPGYYPGFSTLAQQKFWDEATRKVVLKRVSDPPPLRFFSPDEARLMQAVIDRVLPQDDRDDEHKIPILNVIDDRLYHNRIDGYRYEDMPPDREAHRLGLRAIDTIARKVHGQPFVDLSPSEQDLVLKSIHDCQPQAAHDIWQRMDCQRYWMLLMQDCIEGYYAHPWAWDEIGFGGPAYPRGYMRLEHGLPEPWEVEEQRYEWSGPQWSASNEYHPIGTEHGTTTPGQEGTH